LQTRTLREKGLFGLFSRPLVEVTVSPGDASPPEESSLSRRKKTGRLLRRAYGLEEPSGSGEGNSKVRAATESAPVSEIEDGLRSIKTAVGDLFRDLKYKEMAHHTEPLLEVYNHLRAAEVGEEVARRLIRHISETLSVEEQNDRRLVDLRLERIVRGLMEVGGPIGLPEGPVDPDRPRRLVSLIGPTGVGKTTTIAKLAAHFALTEGRRVGLATIDTYRIAAAEQLGQYATMMQLPLRVVARPQDLREVLRDFADRDIVFLDTAGRSPRDRLKMEELGDFLEMAEPDEVHLVLDATTHVRNLLDTAKRFEAVGFNNILVTKLDEADRCGFFLELALSVQKPFSYLTTGQEVPENIEVASALGLAAKILGGSPREAGRSGIRGGTRP
jgi:flagellar biosynthesis protein FlhF